MSKDFASMDKEMGSMGSMLTSTGTGLSVQEHGSYLEVKGQLEKGLKVCSKKYTTNCISVDLQSGQNPQVLIAAGGGAEEEEEHKGKGFSSFSSSSSSAGS